MTSSAFIITGIYKDKLVHVITFALICKSKDHFFTYWFKIFKYVFLVCI